jgi:hypothetical protein
MKIAVHSRTHFWGKILTLSKTRKPPRAIVHEVSRNLPLNPGPNATNMSSQDLMKKR